MIDSLFVFDFDDTLAKTNSVVGINRKHLGKDDKQFRNWLLNHNIYPLNEKTTDSGDHYFYVSTDDFAKFQSGAADVASESIVDTYDFGSTAQIDLGGVTPLKNVIEILKKAESLPNSRVIIVTARSGGEIDTPFGRIKTSNRDDINAFIGSQGVDVDYSHIYAVGSNDPKDKASIVRSYITKLGPKEVYFYDDNEKNLKAIDQLCQEFKGYTEINTFKVVDGLPKMYSEC